MARLHQRLGEISASSITNPLTASALNPKIRLQVRSVDPSLPVYDVFSMNRGSVVTRFESFFCQSGRRIRDCGTSSGFHRNLRAARRRREIGLRVGLGAGRADILRPIIIRGLSRAVVGSLPVCFSLLCAHEDRRCARRRSPARSDGVHARATGSIDRRHVG